MNVDDSYHFDATFGLFELNEEWVLSTVNGWGHTGDIIFTYQNL